jgi:hypothetical protein
MKKPLFGRRKFGSPKEQVRELGSSRLLWSKNTAFEVRGRVRARRERHLQHLMGERTEREHK